MAAADNFSRRCGCGRTSRDGELGLLPLPQREGWGEGLSSSMARNPLTPTLSPSGEREFTAFAALSSAHTDNRRGLTAARPAPVLRSILAGLLPRCAED